jgi:hypothetical protein
MNIRDIIDALRESPFWGNLPVEERAELVFHNARLLHGHKMMNILYFIARPE